MPENKRPPTLRPGLRFRRYRFTLPCRIRSSTEHAANSPTAWSPLRHHQLFLRQDQLEGSQVARRPLPEGLPSLARQAAHGAQEAEGGSRRERRGGHSSEATSQDSKGKHLDLASDSLQTDTKAEARCQSCRRGRGERRRSHSKAQEAESF